MKHDEGQGSVCRGTTLCRPGPTHIHHHPNPVNRNLTCEAVVN
jgi:hypothetical protein